MSTALATRATASSRATARVDRCARARVVARARAAVERASVTRSRRREGDASRRIRATVNDESGAPRMRAAEMKRALVDAGVDVSDCFERADLEVKYAAMKANGAGSTRATADDAKDSGSTRETKSAKEKTADSMAFTNARRFFKESIDAIKERMSLNSIWSSVREKANRVNAKYGTGNKAKSMLEDARRKVKSADDKMGVTKWFKTNVPKAMDQYAKVRNTPVGQFANFMFWIWLFTSGIFWNLLYFGLTATFLVNMFMPSLITDQVENMQRRAQEQMNARGGMGGMGDMGGMGGAQQGGQQGGGRKSYGGGSAGDTIDVDAQVSDRD